MATTPHPYSAATRTISGSSKPETSLRMCAPASSAARATPGWRVSTETSTPRATRASITGTTRAISSSCPTGVKPGRVDSPPTSMRSAPSSSILSAQASASARESCAPPSLKESGVTLSTPMMRVRPKSSVRVPQRHSCASSAMSQPSPSREAKGRGPQGRRRRRRRRASPGSPCASRAWRRRASSCTCARHSS